MRLTWWPVLVGLAGIVTPATAQEPSESAYKGTRVETNPAYDGRYAFVRLRYAGSGCTTAEGPGWHHDYPVADRNLMRMTLDLTRINARVDSTLILTSDDPELMKYPVAYLSEPGCWVPSEAEVAGLRAYLLKGGFLIIDDVFGGDWENFTLHLRRVLPERRLIPLDGLSLPAFQLLFDLKGADLEGAKGKVGTFYGIFEDDDPTKRLMVITNDLADLGNQWQWSGPDQLTNTAYKIGVSYLLYGFTH